MNSLVVVLLILVMVGFNALYVAAEFATVGSRRSRIQESAESGSGPAKSLLVTLQDSKRLDNYVAACQIGITLSSLVAGAYGQAQLIPVFEDWFGGASRAVIQTVRDRGIPASCEGDMDSLWTMLLFGTGLAGAAGAARGHWSSVL